MKFIFNQVRDLSFFSTAQIPIINTSKTFWVQNKNQTIQSKNDFFSKFDYEMMQTTLKYRTQNEGGGGGERL
jgi:hypothetical protein